MSIRSLSIYLLKTFESKYYSQATSLYRLTSKRGYSIIKADNSTETQANNIQANENSNGSITDSENASSDTVKRSSFANRRRVNPEVNREKTNQIHSQTVQQKFVSSRISPSSMLRNWERSDDKLPLNFISVRNEDPLMKSYQNVLVSKLPISVIRRDIEMLTRGIFSDNENLINKIFIIYNDHYKPTGSAWIQFKRSRDALLFTKCIDQKTFYGNKLTVELKRYIPEKIRDDPLNYHTDRCVVLTGLPQSLDEFSLNEFIKEICDHKNFKVINVTPK